MANGPSIWRRKGILHGWFLMSSVTCGWVVLTNFRTACGHHFWVLDSLS